MTGIKLSIYVLAATLVSWAAQPSRAATPAAITTLDESFSGGLVACDVSIRETGKAQGEFTFTVGETTRTITGEKVLSLSWEHATVPAPQNAAFVTTHGGSEFWAQDIVTSENALQWSVASNQSASLALGAVRSLRFDASVESATPWSQFLEGVLDEDRIVVKKSDKVDALDGVLKAIQPDAVVFKVAGIDDAVTLPKARVVGVIPRTPRDASTERASFNLMLADQGVLRIRSFKKRSGEDVAEVELTDGGSLSIPMQQIVTLEAGADGSVYLDRLATERNDFGIPLRRPSLISKDLLAKPLWGNADHLAASGAGAAHTMYLPVGSNLSYRLGGKFNKLKGTIGLAQGELLPVRVSLLSNDSSLWSQVLKPGDAAVEWNIDLPKVERLVLSVECPAFQDMGGWIYLQNGKVAP